MPNDASFETEPTDRLSEVERPTPARRRELERGEVLGARYEIQGLLGKGGMASVYRAFDRVSEQTIAIKVLDEDRSAGHGWVENLGRELRHARRIKHPNVCPVFDFSESEGRCFLTMELAPRGTLRSSLEADRLLADRVADARAVIEGVAAIHEAGVVHRDLKPENMLRAADGHLMVSDLGVAIRADLTTQSGGPAGTRSYMAPELLYGEKATRASDVWSLGVVLHEIFFSRRPEWVVVGGTRRLKPPSGAPGSSLRGLWRLCASCLADVPDKRLVDGMALRRLFEEAISGRRLGRRRLSLLVGAPLLLLLPALFLASRAARHSRPRTVLTGAPLDLAKHSSLLFRTDRVPIQCGQMLPGGTTLRLFLTNPAEAIDVDVSSGRVVPSNLVPEAFASGCPQVSPDGRRLLYERQRPEGRPYVMLSDSPDGREAKMITEGDGPFWLASADAFLYAVDANRSAVFWIGHGPVLFPDAGEGPRRILSHAANQAGDQIATVFGGRLPVTLEIHGYPQTALLRRLELPIGPYPWIEFDPVRGQWQISLTENGRVLRCEIREDGSIARLLQLDGFFVASSYRAAAGLVAIATRGSKTATLVRKADGRTREYPDMPADFGPDGQAAFSMFLPDDRSVIAAQRFDEPRPRILTSGPHDRHPALNPDGKTFLYCAGQNVNICSLDALGPAECHVLHSDPLGPWFARLSPNGRRLAYNVLDASGWRLRIQPMDRQPMRDLSIRGPGAIRWLSDTSLWNCSKSAGGWLEVDALAGRFTGRTLPSPDVNECVPPSGMAELADFEVRRSVNVTTEVRLVQGM
jgi:serine/threonine protein kinase